MGLDMIDFGYRIEKEFKVFIADEDYEHLKTVGDLKSYIEAHSTNVWPCPHIPAFSIIQAGLVNIANCSEDDIRLDTPLTNFSAPTERILFWDQLREETGLKLPSLYFPTVFTVIGFLFVIGVCCTSLLVLFGVITVTYPLNFILALLVLVSLVMPLIDRVLQKLFQFCGERYSWAAPVFPTSTIRKLTRAVASINRPQLVTPVFCHYPEVWPRLVELIVNTIGVGEDEVVPEARFIEDLNC